MLKNRFRTMSQPSVAAFFHSRKRAAVDDIFAAKNKIAATSTDQLATIGASSAKPTTKLFDSTASSLPDTQLESASQNGDVTAIKEAQTPIDAQSRPGRRTPTPQPQSLLAASNRPKRCLKRATSDARKTVSTASVQPKIVKFTLAGNLSPKKKIMRDGALPAAGVSNLFGAKASNVERGLRTPTKEEQHARVAAEKATEARNKLSMDDIKARITRSGRRPELLASLGRMNALEESRHKILNRMEASHLKQVDKHSLSDQQSDRAARILGKSLKTFETIDLEVLSRYFLFNFLVQFCIEFVVKSRF